MAADPLAYLRNLDQWPTGTRPCLRVIWPYCLITTRTIRCERFRFGSMEALLEFWAYTLFQTVEMLTLHETEPDEKQIARGRCSVRRASRAGRLLSLV